MKNIVQIYIRLMGEKMDVWRPVEASRMGKNTYKIISPNPEPDIEKWEFKKGEIVKGKKKVFSDGHTGTIAVKKIS
jgi:hypothetical protein